MKWPWIPIEEFRIPEYPGLHQFMLTIDTPKPVEAILHIKKDGTFDWKRMNWSTVRPERIIAVMPWPTPYDPTSRDKGAET